MCIAVLSDFRQIDHRQKVKNIQYEHIGTWQKYYRKQGPSDDCVKDKIELNNKLTSIQDIVKGLEEIKIALCALPDDVNLTDSLDVIVELEEEAQEMKVSLLVFLSKYDKEPESVINIPKGNIKLPDLSLPTFNGRFQEFEVFKVQFMNVIGNNPCLDETQKLCYLKSALKNDASLIQSDQDTFESLMKALESRYENKRALVDIHISEILYIHKIQNENPAQIRLLTDTVRSHLRSLKNLKMESNQLSDAIILHILINKIDKESQRLFHLSLTSTEVPSLQNFLSFLENRCIQLESIYKTDFAQRNIPIKSKYNSGVNATNTSRLKSFLAKNKQTKKCIIAECNSFHPLYKCDKFKNLSLVQRKELVKNNRICARCLSSNHATNCPSSYSCISCKNRNVNAMHNILLCDDRFINPTTSINSGSECEVNVEPSTHRVSLTSRSNSIRKGLLNTAFIYVKGPKGKMKVRCVLDSASENSFLTLKGAEMLGLNKIKTNSTVQGLNNSISKINYLVKASVSNFDDTFHLDVDFFLTTEIIKTHPSKKIKISEFTVPTGCVLADKDFNEPSEISCLLGSEHFFDIFGPNQIRLPNSNLRLVESKFGFVVAGSFNDELCYPNNCLLSKGLSNLDNTLRSFWETENISEEQPIFSDELTYCEDHFERTHIRKPSGRYSVSLPFKQNISENVNLGDSRTIAFLKNTRSSSDERVIGPLSHKELDASEIWLLKLVQSSEFANEIKNLQKGEPVPRNNFTTDNILLDLPNIGNGHNDTFYCVTVAVKRDVQCDRQPACHTSFL
ncbi:unnamed protein product [Larinioides sclopetarius]|uniref:Peptidase aspartic putative domain-containing protein n=1 Tax=Larinioides sclopetarius TaxID=280406 RepID=A0AAV1ZP10_9ARAC